MDNDQVQVAKGRAPRMMKYNDPTGTVLYPDMDNTGYEVVSRQFAARRLTQALTDEQYSRRKYLIENLTQLKEPEEGMEVDDDDGIRPEDINLNDEEIRIQEHDWHVTKEQVQVLKFLDKPDSKILAVQAPAGTGKTYTIALYLLKLLENLKGTVLVTAPTNLAVQEITGKVLDVHKPKAVKSCFCSRSPMRSYPTRLEATNGRHAAFQRYCKPTPKTK